MTFSRDISLVGSSIYFALVIMVISTLITGMLLQSLVLDELVSKKAKTYSSTFQHIEDAWKISSHPETRFSNKKQLLTFGRDSIIAQKKQWGVYEHISVETKNKHVKKHGLFTNNNRLDDIALFIADSTRSLGLSGDTHIKGTLVFHESATKDGQILRNRIDWSRRFSGSIKTHNTSLPKVSSDISSHIQDLILDIPPNQPNEDFREFTENIQNSFSNETLIVQSKEPIYLNLSIKGNVIILAPKIYISARAIVEDALIVAHEIEVEKNAILTTQLIADKSITLNENVELHYPSSIYVQTNRESKLSLGKNSLIEGIVAHQNSHRLSSTVIQNGATIHGQLFSRAKTSFQGNMRGNCLVETFFLSTRTTGYKNFLRDATFDGNSRSPYIECSILDNEFNESRIPVKWIK